MSDIAPSAPGGERSAQVGSLDLSTEADRGLLREHIGRRPRRWAGMTDEFKARCLDALAVALEEAAEIEDVSKRVKARDSIVRTAAIIERQNQADELVLIHAQIDAERATAPAVVVQQHTVITVAPPRTLGE